MCTERIRSRAIARGISALEVTTRTRRRISNGVTPVLFVSSGLNTTFDARVHAHSPDVERKVFAQTRRRQEREKRENSSESDASFGWFADGIFRNASRGGYKEVLEISESD